MTQPTDKPTPEEIALIAQFCTGITHHWAEDRARVRRLLDAYAALEAENAKLRAEVERLDARNEARALVEMMPFGGSDPAA